MPRRPDPSKDAHRQKTGRWREKLRILRQPESCHVDTAVSAAVSAYLVHLQDDGSDVPDAVQDIVNASLTILRERGFHGRGAARKLSERLILRKDRFALVDTVYGHSERITSVSAKTDASPHYFSVQNRSNRDSDSDREA